MSSRCPARKSFEMCGCVCASQAAVSTSRRKASAGLIRREETARTREAFPGLIETPVKRSPQAQQCEREDRERRGPRRGSRTAGAAPAATTTAAALGKRIALRLCVAAGRKTETDLDGGPEPWADRGHRAPRRTRLRSCEIEELEERRRV